MKWVSAIGFAILAIWMAYISWELHELRNIALQTCGIAYADIEGWNLKSGRRPPEHPAQCPWIDLLHGP